jgi:hypothetical protein
MTSYRVRLDDGTVIDAEVAHDDPAHRHDVGDEVPVRIRAADAVFIPDQA